MKKIFFLMVIFFASTAKSGELISRTSGVYGSFYVKNGCAWQQTGARTINVGGVYQLYPDMSLLCSATSINDRIATKIVTGASSCSYELVGPNATNYEVSQRFGTCDGMISLKSEANVFYYRNYSQYYEAYSQDGILDKPVILVEGLDVENTNYPVHYYNDNYFGKVWGGGVGFRRIVENGSGRDLFIVNFSNGSDSLSNNAAILVNIIKEINAAKKGNHPIAIIGYSMGGIIARMALKNMENAGTPHNTSLYISYDAPHMGANAPQSLQNTVNSMIGDFSKWEPILSVPSSLRDAKRIYSNPAAKEMLLTSSDLKTTNYAGFPEKLVRIAVSNGSVSDTKPDATLKVNDAIASFSVTYRENDIGSWSSDHFTWKSMNIGLQYYDNIPGSFSQIFDESYLKIKDSKDIDSFNEYSPFVANKHVTFVPTFSALAVEEFPLGQSAKVKDYFQFSPFDKFIVADGFSSCNRSSTTTYSSNDGSNIPHDYFDWSIMSKINCALDDYHKVAYEIPSRTTKAKYLASLCPSSGILYQLNVPAGNMSTVMPIAAAYCSKTSCTSATPRPSAGFTGGSPTLYDIYCR